MSRTLSFFALVAALFVAAAAFTLAASHPFHRFAANKRVGGASTPSLVYVHSTGATVLTTPMAVNNGANFLVGNAQGHLVNIDRGTGTSNWTFAATVPKKGDDQQDLIYAQPTVDAAGLGVFVADSTGTLYNLAIPTGHADFTFDLNEDPVLSRPLIVGKSNVVVATYDGVVYNFNLNGNGMQQWNFTSGSFISADPMLSILPDGSQLIIVPSHDGTVYALDAATGKVTWKTASKDDQPIVNSCAQDSTGFIYCTVNGGQVFRMNATTGTIVWSVRVSGSPSAGPVLSGDQASIYFPSNFNQVYALTTANGATQWIYENDVCKSNYIRQAVAVSPTTSNVIIGTTNCNGQPTLAGLHLGKRVWEVSANNSDEISTGIYADGGLMAVGTKGGNVLVFSA